MANVICMASAKGGSGKTVLTATFSAFLCSLSKKVLIVDTDASTNGLSLMYLKEIMMQNEQAISEDRKPLGTYEIASDDTGLFDYPEIVKLPNGVDLIPATYSFVNTEDFDLVSFEGGLKFLVVELGSEYDYIFLDAQAGSDNFAHAAMKRGVSNEVVIVSEYDPLSAAGVERLKALFREELTYNRTWVLLNKMLPDFVQSFSDFMEVAKYLSPIPWDADVVRAYARRKLALDLEYGNEFTLAIMQTLKALLGQSIEKDLDKWLESRASAIRQPIIIQYNDAEKELESLLKLRYEADLKRNLKQKRLIFFRAILFVMFIVLSMFGYVYFPRIFGETSAYLKYAYAGVVLFIVSLASTDVVKKFFSLEYKPDEFLYQAKLRREVDALENKLKKLETLRNAEVETLIKMKG